MKWNWFKKEIKLEVDIKEIYIFQISSKQYIAKNISHLDANEMKDLKGLLESLSTNDTYATKLNIKIFLLDGTIFN